MTTYNKRPKINKLKIVNNLVYFTITYVDLEGQKEYSLEKKKITNVLYHQDINNYCNILEGEIRNVVDRDNPTKVRDLTVRTDYNNLELSSDTCKLILPTRIEKILDFKIHVSINHIMEFTTSLKFGPYNPLDFNDSFEIVKSWGDMKKYDNFLPVATDIERYLNTQNIIIKDETPVIGKWLGIGTTKIYYSTNVRIINTTASIMSNCLEYSQWQILPAYEQPKYCYYKSGGYSIENLYKHYKDNWIEQFLGITTYPFLNYVEINANRSEITHNLVIDGENIPIKIKPTADNPTKIDDDNPLVHTFDVDYISISDIKMMDEKTLIPFNEKEYKNFGRGYNNSSNFVDYNRLESAMSKTNNTLGQAELSIEFLSDSNKIPEIAQKIIYDGNEWYAISIEKEVSGDKELCVVNLVRDYNKIADAIGVPTQYNSLPNPTNNIVDRFIFVSLNSILNECQLERLYIKLYDYNHKRNIFKRADIKKGEKKEIIFSCEAVNEYSIGTRAIRGDDFKFMNEDVPYVDKYNELYILDLCIVRLPKLTYNQSLNLPLYDGPFECVSENKTVKIYKDAREKLLFTIKLKNAIMK